MAHRVSAALAAVLLASAPVASGAADTPKPLRTLTFAIELSVADNIDTPGAALGTGARAVAGKGRIYVTNGGPGGSGEGHREAQAAATGSIDVAVLQATDDAGLIVEIGESTNVKVRPKVRVGIASDGTLLYDAASAEALSEEELIVAHWLSRGFYGGRPTEAGTSWSVDQSGNGHTDVERYRVVSREADRVTLAYSLEQQTSVLRAFAGTRAGSLVYDTAMSVPVKATIATLARRQVGDARDTVRSEINLTLTADSFARARS